MDEKMKALLDRIALDVNAEMWVLYMHIKYFGPEFLN